MDRIHQESKVITSVRVVLITGIRVIWLAAVADCVDLEPMPYVFFSENEQLGKVMKLTSLFCV